MNHSLQRPRRVLLASHYYPPHQGGIENVVYHEAQHLARLGAEVTVLASGPRSGETPDGPGVRVVRVAAWNGTEERAGVPFPVPVPGLLATALRWARWADIVHVHDCLYITSWSAGAAAALAGTPHVLTQHVGLVHHPSALVRQVQRTVYRVAARRLLRRAACVLVVNASVGAFAVRQGARRETVRHLANGVDAELFRPAASPAERDATRRRYGLPTDRVLVLFAGRLVPKKGYDILLAAADAGYDLVFVGQSFANRPAPARPGVHHIGALSPRGLAEMFRACDIFALPSVAEGFPLTVQEAMASALPVATTDDPGYAPYDLDRDQVTLLPREPAAYRTHLSALAADPERRRRMGDWARRYITANFSWDIHAEALLDLYDEVLARRPRPAPAG